jgi:hypothetical protein
VTCDPGLLCDGTACVCPGLGEVECAGTCIQPKTDPTFCGAVGDCVGVNAGAFCGVGEACCHGVCSPSCVGVLAPSNLDPVSCEFTALTDLLVPVGQTLSFSTDGACSEVRAQPNAPDLCVMRYGTVTISGTLSVTGSRALALLATGDMLIDGTVDVAGQGNTNGPGASAIVGGAYGTPGGSGAPAFGDPSIIPLSGGSKGPGGNAVWPYPGRGGGAGGGLELVACATLHLSGLVSAGGAGGFGDDGTSLFSPAGGGGSGGGVLIEAPVVVLTGSVFANGGGGGGGGFSSSIETFNDLGGNGEGGHLSSGPALGGHGGASECLGSSGPGGRGGASTPPESGVPATADCGTGWCGSGPVPLPPPCPLSCGTCQAGGPGGAVGRIRVNDASGTPSIAGGTFSPAPTTGGIALTP